MAQIELHNVTKCFAGQCILNKVNLTVADKAFCVILGPSGCGKSTMLRIIAGLEPLTDGRIHIRGRDVTSLPPKDRNVSMVFQSYALYPHMTVYENIAFGLKRRGATREEIRERVHRVARTMQIEHLLSSKPVRISGGQRQRVAIGRAIVREPDVLLLDEPLSNLDAELRVQMRLEFIRLHQQLGTTVVYVTHDQVEAMTLAEKMVVLHQGRIIQEGSPMSLYNFPNSLFVAGFIGTPKINLLPGRITATRQGEVTVTLFDNRLIRVVNATSAVHVGDSVTVGIRPEHLSLAPGKNNVISGEIILVEQLGDHSLLYVTVAGRQEPLIVRTYDAQPLPSDGKVSLYFSPDRCHFFAADGWRINTMSRL